MDISSSTVGSVHILLAESEEQQRIFTLLKDYADVTTHAQRVRRVSSSQPAVILLDIHRTSLEKVTEIKEQFPDAFVAFTNVDDLGLILPYLCIPGVNGMFHKGEKAEIIQRGLASMMAGLLWFPRDILPQVINQIKLAPGHNAVQLNQLSKKELEVLKMLTQGVSNTEMAHSLNISFHTVKTHIYNIYKKLNVKNRAEAVKLASSALT